MSNNNGNPVVRGGGSLNFELGNPEGRGDSSSSGNSGGGEGVEKNRAFRRAGGGGGKFSGITQWEDGGRSVYLTDL